MITDDERREVARKLRGDPCDTLIPHRAGIHFGMGCHEAADRFWDMCGRIKTAGDYDIDRSTCSVLADLIEPVDRNDELCAHCDYCDYCDLPECSEQDGYSFKPKGYVDLLVLADELGKDADDIISAARNAQFTGSGPRMEEAKHDAHEWRCIASRIRKALGVEQ